MLPLRTARITGLVAGIFALFLCLVAGSRLSNPLFDFYQRLSPRDLAATPVRVVEIDPESLALIGPWPWSRYDMAALTDRIGRAGARAIGFDMVFPEVDRQTPALFARRYPELPPAARAAVLALPSLDEDFAQVLGRYPTVLARAGVTAGSVDFAGADGAAALPVEAVFTGPLPHGVIHWPRAVASIPAIEETSAGHGLINGDPDDDGVVRRIPLVGLLGGTPNTGFALENVRVALDEERVTSVLTFGRLFHVRLGDRLIPTGTGGRFRPHFGHLPPSVLISAADIFRRGFDAGRLRGAIVLVSVTGAGGTDVVATPLDATIDGVRVQAQAADAILRGGWLTRSPWTMMAEPLLAALLVAGAVLWLPRLRGRAAVIVPLAVVLALPLASWLAFRLAGQLVDPLTPLLPFAAAGLAILVALFVEQGRAQRALRDSAARAAGELEAARDIQLGMLPGHNSLAMLDPRIDLDAILEPARAVGGDFYDAFPLGDGRTAFLIGDVTGKGVPAALFMALSKALARTTLMARPDDLAAAVDELNRELSRDNARDMFVTMLLGIADGRTGEVALVNAGHENPLLVRTDGTVEELRMEGGPPLCVADGFPYEVEPLVLAPGEGLIVVTDGVTEAQDRAGAFFDRERVVRTLAVLPRDWHAADATAAITLDVRDFEAGAEASDDLTVLAVKRRG